VAADGFVCPAIVAEAKASVCRERWLESNRFDPIIFIATPADPSTALRAGRVLRLHNQAGSPACRCCSVKHLPMYAWHEGNLPKRQCIGNVTNGYCSALNAGVPDITLILFQQAPAIRRLALFVSGDCLIRR
jgi:hypothetical protein